MTQLSDEFKNMSLSNGTMRECDLIEAFKDFIEHELPDVFEGLNVRHQSELGWNEPQELCDGFVASKDWDDAIWLLDILFEVLNEYAPDGYYFGAHPGNGSDYGFWEVEEEIL